MKIDIVTPERQLFSADVTSVSIPGMEGDMTIMENHGPMVTTLRPGVVVTTGGDTAGEFVVTGGFVEVSRDGTSVLAERAMPRAEVTPELMEDVLAATKQAVDIAPELGKAAARMRVNDVTELQKRIG